MCAQLQHHSSYVFRWKLNSHKIKLSVEIYHLYYTHTHTWDSTSTFMRTLSDVTHSVALLVIIYLSVTVNKSHKNTKINTELCLIAVTSEDPEPDLAYSSVPQTSVVVLLKAHQWDTWSHWRHKIQERASKDKKSHHFSPSLNHIPISKNQTVHARDLSSIYIRSLVLKCLTSNFSLLCLFTFNMAHEWNAV